MENILKSIATLLLSISLCSCAVLSRDTPKFIDEITIKTERLSTQSSKIKVSVSLSETLTPDNITKIETDIFNSEGDIVTQGIRETNEYLSSPLTVLSTTLDTPSIPLGQAEQMYKAEVKIIKDQKLLYREYQFFILK